MITTSTSHLFIRMWDVDDSGCINLQEMTNIVATMDDVEGVEQEPKVNFL